MPEKELIVYLSAASADLAIRELEFHQITLIVVLIGAVATVLFAIYWLLKKLFAARRRAHICARCDYAYRKEEEYLDSSAPSSYPSPDHPFVQSPLMTGGCQKCDRPSWVHPAGGTARDLIDDKERKAQTSTRPSRGRA